MATIITNQARIDYRYGSRTLVSTSFSNVASAVFNGQLEVEKTSLSQNYRIGQDITYFISVTNQGDTTSENVTVTDNLGTYQVGSNNYTPLTYIGPAQLFIDGVFEAVLTPEVNENNIVFEINEIPANSNARIVYIARPNSYANGEIGSEITNTATARCDCICNEPGSDDLTLTAEAFADVRIVKSICPNPIICGDEVTFTFDIFNYGNLEATDVVLTDTFSPPISDIEVRVNGILIPSDDYDYIAGVLTLPAPDSDFSIVVPPATFVQNPQTGMISVTPGRVQIVVTGRI